MVQPCAVLDLDLPSLDPLNTSLPKWSNGLCRVRSKRLSLPWSGCPGIYLKSYQSELSSLRRLCDSAIIIDVKSILIRNLPEAVVSALKKRAAENNRSLQKELRHLLITVAQETAQKSTEEFELVLAKGVTTAITWSRDEIYGDDAR